MDDDLNSVTFDFDELEKTDDLLINFVEKESGTFREKPQDVMGWYDKKGMDWENDKEYLEDLRKNKIKINDRTQKIMNWSEVEKKYTEDLEDIKQDKYELFYRLTYDIITNLIQLRILKINEKRTIQIKRINKGIEIYERLMDKTIDTINDNAFLNEKLQEHLKKIQVKLKKLKLNKNKVYNNLENQLERELAIIKSIINNNNFLENKMSAVNISTAELKSLLTGNITYDLFIMNKNVPDVLFGKFADIILMIGQFGTLEEYKDVSSSYDEGKLNEKLQDAINNTILTKKDVITSQYRKLNFDDIKENKYDTEYILDKSHKVGYFGDKGYSFGNLNTYYINKNVNYKVEFYKLLIAIGRFIEAVATETIDQEHFDEKKTSEWRDNYLDKLGELKNWVFGEYNNYIVKIAFTEETKPVEGSSWKTKDVTIGVNKKVEGFKKKVITGKLSLSDFDIL